MLCESLILFVHRSDTSRRRGRGRRRVLACYVPEEAHYCIRKACLVVSFIPPSALLLAWREPQGPSTRAWRTALPAGTSPSLHERPRTLASVPLA